MPKSSRTLQPLALTIHNLRHREGNILICCHIAIFQNLLKGLGHKMNKIFRQK